VSYNSRRLASLYGCIWRGLRAKIGAFEAAVLISLEPDVKFGSSTGRAWKENDLMPDTRHETEADKILSALSLTAPDEQTLLQGRRLLAEALEQAERRGRQILGNQKESSG
jgi:hypothetical protein